MKQLRNAQTYFKTRCQMLENVLLEMFKLCDELLKEEEFIEEEYI